MAKMMTKIILMFGRLQEKLSTLGLLERVARLSRIFGISRLQDSNPRLRIVFDRIHKNRTRSSRHIDLRQAFQLGLHIFRMLPYNSKGSHKNPI